MKNNRTNNKASKVIATIIATIVATTSISAPVFANGLDEAKEAVAAASTSVETLTTTVDASVNDGGAIASESVEAFVEELENINSSETVNEAASEIQTVENEINAAAQADKNAEDKATEAVANLSSAAQIANEAVVTAEETKAQANDLVNIITNSEATDEQVNEALDKLDTITNDAAQTIETKKEVIAAISSKFEEAKAELEKAEKAYEESVKNLKSEEGSAKKAAQKLDEAKKDVEVLEAAYDKAVEALEKEEALVEDIKAVKEVSDANDNKNNWKPLNALMKSIMTGYIIPNMMDKDATNISYSTSTQRGFDRQNSSYCIVKYTDKDGNEVTRYFNIDRVDRKINEKNQWADLGKSNEIYIYEKPEEDITSSLYQISRYGNINVTQQFKNDVNAGKYDVYAFDFAEGKEYKCIDELEAGVADGTITLKDGVYYMNGTAARKIVQTTSGNATGIKVSTKDDEGLKNYIENASKLVEKYEKYGETIADTKDKIDEASEKVEALTDVISVIEDSKSRVANVIDEIKAYLSEEDLAKVLAATSDKKAMEILEGILTNAKKDLESASAELEELMVKREELRVEINEKNNAEIIPAVEEIRETAAVETKETVETTAVETTTALTIETREMVEETTEVEEVILPAQTAAPLAPAVVNNAAANASYDDSDYDSEEVFVSDVALFANANANAANNAAVSNTVASQSSSTDDIAGAVTSWWAVFTLAVLEILRVISPLFV